MSGFKQERGIYKNHWKGWRGRFKDRAVMTSRKIPENLPTKETDEEAGHVCVNHRLLAIIRHQEAVTPTAAPESHTSPFQELMILSELVSLKLHLAERICFRGFPHTACVWTWDIYWHSTADPKVSVFTLVTETQEEAVVCPPHFCLPIFQKSTKLAEPRSHPNICCKGL